MFHKRNDLKILSVIVLTFVSFASSQLVTEDLLSNAGFDDIDNLGLPVDWKMAGKPEERGLVYKVDTETKHAGDGALMITVGEDGNSKDALVNQDLFTTLADQEKLYCKAWIKYKNVSSQAGFQLVITQAQRLPAEPWFKTVKWNSWASGGGTQEDWHQVESEIDIHPDANTWIFRVYLRSGMFPGCTVWVDDIELSTEPVSVFNTVSQKNRANMIFVNGNQVQFNRPANYQMQVFSANGQQIYTQSGNGTTAHLVQKNMATGCYVVKIQSDIGSMVKSFVINER